MQNEAKEGADMDVTLQEARQQAQSGLHEGAAESYRKLLKHAEYSVEANVFLYRFASRHGRFAEAAFNLESLLSTHRVEPVWHHHLGQVLQKLAETDPQGTALIKLVELLPFAYSSRLVLGRLLEVQGQLEQATQHYLSAINTANRKGFWHNEASTAPWCRAFVLHALKTVEQYRQHLFHSWLEPLWEEYGKEAMQRVSKTMKMFSGELPLELADKRQIPSFLYVPDLPISPVFDAESLPFAEEYESKSEQIIQELHALLDDGYKFKLFQEGEAGRGLTEGGDWNAFFFHRHGKTFSDNHSRCPNTSAALQTLPLVRIKEHGPEVCFSLMQPGSHILPHRGVTNSRAVLHMGLIIPDHCRLNLLNVQEISWQQGKIFAFDDTYLHEAWNRSEQLRAVLLADIWNPFLSQEECMALTTLIEKIGVFNRQHTPGDGI
ncbi:aspartyl/asparaginyl beta-hydroxylase domain-containing protein [Bowmanella pacifica]|uniref:Aspartyl/asparaginy/proline hydroxylase domain-containing protein n=1 Tax=Bowmanella pacifica TaxID=502051 RepID=A0A917Z245_9ALTE|nr:aspartyl/asparaginyl beta-hydroxylase domain-containing protein [Bowmanella pacifica]GGO72264.1 hypothetical protein GCM10010982_29970 [Bowmanella pacifica]